MTVLKKNSEAFNFYRPPNGVFTQSALHFAISIPVHTNTIISTYITAVGAVQKLFVRVIATPEFHHCTDNSLKIHPSFETAANGLEHWFSRLRIPRSNVSVYLFTTLTHPYIVWSNGEQFINEPSVANCAVMSC